MRAAVLHAIGETPRFEEMPDPVPGDGEQLVTVTAAPVNAIDRALAAGTHYAKPATLPAVVGIVAAGRLPDGSRVIFGSRSGTMAQYAAVSPQACFPIPDGIDDAVAAAVWNPGLSAWMLLSWRAKLEPGQSVLVIGATGVTGRLAVQAARVMGAGRVVGAGRNPESLDELLRLGADEVISLEQPDEALEEAFTRAGGEHGFDIVVDYVWGRPTEVFLRSLERHDLEPRMLRTRLVQTGDMGGATITLPASVLRSGGLEIVGNGSGSMPGRDDVVRMLQDMLGHLESGALRIDVDRVPLSRVEEVWGRDQRGRRPVLVP